MPNTFETLLSPGQGAPDRPRLTFLHDDGAVETLSALQLRQRATELADRLASRLHAGSRVLLAHPPGLDFVVDFFACLKAGLIPVPVSDPKPRRPLSRYASIVSDCQASLALTSESTLARIDPQTMDSIHWTTAERWENPSEEQPSQSVIRETVAPSRNGNASVSESIAFLQYTSGSTSRPKGVMVSHENLFANLQVIEDGFRLGELAPEERIVCSWLPAFHDMGLVGVILSAVMHDGHAVMMPPTTFVRQPSRWLQAMTDYQARITVAPCFGYSWSATKITPEESANFDLSRLRLAACGAEPIFPQTLHSFGERFEKTGFRREAFYPCYGLAESTLMVTGADHRSELGAKCISISRVGLRHANARDAVDSADTMELVSSGVVGQNTELRIVDPKTNDHLGDDHVGEIRVHSPSVAMGYWSNPSKSDEVFRSKIKGDDRSWLRTGDMGFVRDGHLYVTGRMKDVIIVGGQNHFPQDIELSVQRCHPTLSESSGAAFAVANEGTEQVVIVQEIPRDFQENEWEPLLREIRLSVAREHELAVQEIVLIRHASLPRTSSGKVQRHRCREMWDADSFKLLTRWRQQDELDPELFADVSELAAGPNAGVLVREEIESSMLKWLARHTESDLDTLHPDQSFAEFGVDSLLAVELSRQLESWLGVRLSPVAAWSYPTPSKLAEHLSALVVQRSQPDSPAEDESLQGMEDLLAEIELMDETEVQRQLEQTMDDSH